MKKYSRIVLISVVAVLATQACILAQDSEVIFPGKHWDYYEKAEDAGYSTEKLQGLLPYLVEESNTTGLFVVVGGKVLGEYGDVEELSYVASVRKSILAMLYGKYVESGTIDLEKTLEELKIDDNGGLLPIEKQATIHHLITARSGVYHPASNAGDNSADAPERGSQKPGEYMLYNNWDFNAAGAVFEMLTGLNIYDAVERDLARPIDMQDFDRWEQHKSGNLERSRYPAYHMWFSTRDMARIGYLMLREGNWNGKQVVPKQWVKRISSVVTPLEEMNPPYRRDRFFGYGYMWWIWDGPQAAGPFKGAYNANGYYGQYITVLPALDMVVAHKTKSDYRRRTSWEMYEGILERIIDARLPE
jgi:CubicO group peptidase (beta-lactamase class C family)